MCVILSTMLDTKYILNILAVLVVFGIIQDDLRDNF